MIFKVLAFIGIIEILTFYVSVQPITFEMSAEVRKSRHLPSSSDISKTPKSCAVHQYRLSGFGQFSVPTIGFGEKENSHDDLCQLRQVVLVDEVGNALFESVSFNLWRCSARNKDEWHIGKPLFASVMAERLSKPAMSNRIEIRKSNAPFCSAPRMRLACVSP